MTDSVKIIETTTILPKAERPENWRTLLLVGAIIGVGIVAAAYLLTGWKWGTFCAALALYEAWTLTNQYKEDTISEAIWILARRPITVLLFSVAFGIAAGSGYLGDPKTVLRAWAIGLLFGHFFFTPAGSESITSTTKKV